MLLSPQAFAAMSYICDGVLLFYHHDVTRHTQIKQGLRGNTSCFRAVTIVRHCVGSVAELVLLAFTSPALFSSIGVDHLATYKLSLGFYQQ
jgi:hypothetical protein